MALVPDPLTAPVKRQALGAEVPEFIFPNPEDPLSLMSDDTQHQLSAPIHLKVLEPCIRNGIIVERTPRKGELKGRKRKGLAAWSNGERADWLCPSDTIADRVNSSAPASWHQQTRSHARSPG